MMCQLALGSSSKYTSFAVLLQITFLVIFISQPNYVTAQNLFGVNPRELRNYFTSRRNANFRNFTTPNLIKRNGYPVERHWAATEDGYILELHRVPYGKKFPERTNKPPVIIQHGNFQSSADWMLNDPPNALPLILADNGYDVWLGNQRGNTYSNRHMKYSFRSPNFWNWSYHEAAFYDVPAAIDYVLDSTGQSKLFYVCHSVGCKNLVAGLSLRPEYNDKIVLAMLMGPAGFMSYMFNGYARLISPILNLGRLALAIFGNMPATPHSITALERSLRPRLCQSNVDIIGVCPAFFFSVFGLDREQITQEKLNEIEMVFPSTSSFKLWMHLVQEIQSGHFRQYDYGIQRNMEVYGRPRPPDYQLENVKIPISILHGERDHIARIEDTQALMKALPNVVDFYIVPWKNWTHMDFNYAKDAGRLNHGHIVELLGRYRDEFDETKIEPSSAISHR